MLAADADKLVRVKGTIFGPPVVPDVCNTNAGSALAPPTVASALGATGANPVAIGSPGAAIRRSSRRTPAAAKAAPIDSATSLVVMAMRTAKSRSACSISPIAEAGFSGAQQPADIAPKHAIAISGPFGKITAIRVEGLAPIARSAPAQART